MIQILCSADRASRYIREVKTNLMHYLSSVYFVIQPLYVSGIFVAHHQEVYCIHTQQLVRVVIFSWLSVGRVEMEPACRHSTEQHNTCQLLYIYSIPPDDGLQICPKHIEVDWRNKLRINSVWCSVSLHGWWYKFALNFGIIFSATAFHNFCVP